MTTTSRADRRIRRTAVPLALAAGIIIGSPPPAMADGQLRALLVGVSSYQNELNFKPLRGPANDVALLTDQLRQRGFPPTNIVALAESADAKGRPTRAAIIAELDGLADTTRRDDIIYIHFSGHGSQQPNDNPDYDQEPDGLDEIFLPRDAGVWIDEAGTVSNAIIDDEIAARVTAMRNKGAFVVVVGDQCHAETFLRAPNLQEQDRGVEPERLGIPKAALDAAKARAPGLRGGGREQAALDTPSSLAEGAGGLVAIYAAQSTEKAPELPLPAGAGETEKKIYGLLSFNLASVLAAHPGITYRQAAEQILQNYRALGRWSPTPIIEGKDADLNTLVFGSTAGAPFRQWPVQVDGTTWRIPAGRLHQISEDTILAVVPDPATLKEADPVGYARVSKADTLSSTIEPMAYGDRPAPAKIPARAFARVVDARLALQLEVALPEKSTEAWPAEIVAGRELDRLRQDGSAETKMSWVAPGASSADLRLLVRDNRLWFLPPSGALVMEGPGRSASLAIPATGQGNEAALDGFRREIGENLRKLAKVKALFALAKELSGNELARDLTIELEIKRASGGATETVGMTEEPELHDRDVLGFKVTNKGGRSVDLTVLYIDSRQRIEPWFPLGGRSNRLHPGGTVTEHLVVNLETVGPEQLLFIAAAAETAAPRTDFSFLAQEGLRGPGASGASAVSELLRDAGVRGGEHPPVTLATARSFGWRVVPGGPTK